jgi:hypothetical protein
MIVNKFLSLSLSLSLSASSAFDVVMEQLLCANTLFHRAYSQVENIALPVPRTWPRANTNVCTPAHARTYTRTPTHHTRTRTYTYTLIYTHATHTDHSSTCQIPDVCVSVRVCARVFVVAVGCVGVSGHFHTHAHMRTHMIVQKLHPHPPAEASTEKPASATSPERSCPETKQQARRP